MTFPFRSVKTERKVCRCHSITSTPPAYFRSVRADRITACGHDCRCVHHAHACWRWSQGAKKSSYQWNLHCLLLSRTLLFEYLPSCLSLEIALYCWPFECRWRLLHGAVRSRNRLSLEAVDRSLSTAGYCSVLIVQVLLDATSLSSGLRLLRWADRKVRKVILIR